MNRLEVEPKGLVREHKKGPATEQSPDRVLEDLWPGFRFLILHQLEAQANSIIQGRGHAGNPSLEGFLRNAKLLCVDSRGKRKGMFLSLRVYQSKELSDPQRGHSSDRSRGTVPDMAQ